MARSTLDHPLPSGMRDLLPPETIARRAIARAFLGRAELCGYEPVSLPAIEYAETIERGLGTLDPQEIVRFVEPETGEVVALRPDVTPQIARLVATRLASRPGPYRLAYDASVLRRRAGSRARTHRQIPQIGVELIGVPGPDGDLELWVLAAEALAAMGLRAFTLDVGHAEVARALLARLPPAHAGELAEALAAKDVAAVARLAAAVEPAVRDALIALPTLHGPPALLDALPPCLTDGPAAPAIAALRALVTALTASLRARSIDSVTVAVDLGEVRGHAYYTGPFFQLFAEGPGTPIGGGGRYDGLLGRFGRALPATGLALDVDALTWALHTAGSTLLRAPGRCVIVEGPRAQELADRVRAREVPAVLVPAADAEAYARAWGYGTLARVDGDRVVLTALEAPALAGEPLSIDAALATIERRAAGLA